MNLKSIVLSLMLTAAVTLIVSTTANAQARTPRYNLAIVTNNGNCLLPDANRIIHLFKCADNGGARYWIDDNARIHTADDFCFDYWDGPVRLARCDSSRKSQVWYWSRDARNLVQNAFNDKLCVDIEGGNDTPGTRVITYTCAWSGKPNQQFYMGGQIGYTDSLRLPRNVRDNVNGGRVAVFSNGSRMVAAGAGNIIAAGAGNMVAAGAGNLIGLDGATLAQRIVTSLVGNDGSSLIRNNSSGSLIGNDGAGLLPNIRVSFTNP